MKLWLCVLSALLLAGCTAGTDVPGSVTPTAVPTPAATETGETAEAAATPAPTADAVQPPQGLVETGAAVLDYDDIRLLRYSRELQSYPEVEYYTMCKDGKWGLMRSDGSEVLPCRAPEPLFECGLGNRHWHDYTNGLSWEAADALRKEYARQLQACGDGVICDGHDGDGYLDVYHNQITMIPEGDKYELLGWIAPRLDKFSVSRSYFSWLMPKKRYDLDTNLNGGRRALVVTGLYDRYLPMNIYPIYLLKACMAGDIDKMENLGIYEVLPEDFALCEFVDPSKTEMQAVIADGINLMIKELS